MPEGTYDIKDMLLLLNDNIIDNQRNTIDNQSVIIKGMIKEIRNLYITIFILGVIIILMLIY